MYCSRLSRLSVLLATLVGTTACIDSSPDLGSNQTPSWETFRATTYREPFGDRLYIVDGDIPLQNEEELFKFWQSLQQGGLAVRTQGGTDDRWDDTTKLDLKYCISNNFGGNKALVVSSMQAAADRWASFSNVRFVYLPAQDSNCTNSNTNVVFNVRQVSGTLYLARAFFPGYARASRELLVDTNSFASPPWSLVNILGHELGHTLGFRHEHTRPNAGACFEDNDWRPLTPYDSASIMHYPQCNGTSNTLEWTRSDARGAAILYGSPRGPADLFWRNSDGSLAMWLMSATASVWAYSDPQAIEPEWQFSGTGDFNGDGHSDLVWRSTVTGNVAIWLMNGSTILAFLNPGTATSDWDLRTIGDTDDNGISDLIWQNSTTGNIAIWLMNSSGAIQTYANPGNASGWTVLGAADFSGDGRADLLFRNGSSLMMWRMNGATIASTLTMGSITSEWVFQGLGDFNRDGMADIVWRSNVTGNVAIWWMSTATVLAYVNPGTATSNWVLKGVSDITADGVADLVLRDTTTGNVAIWAMSDDGTIAFYSNPGSAASSWDLQGMGTFD